LTAVFSTIQQIQAIPGQLPFWEPGGVTLSSTVPEVVWKALFLIIYTNISFNKRSLNVAQVKGLFFMARQNLTKSGIDIRAKIIIPFDAEFKATSNGTKIKSV